MTTTRNLYSDLHKDVYGVRPGSSTMANVNAMSDKEFDTHWDQLCYELGQTQAEEARREQKAQIDFETKLTVIKSAFDLTAYDAMRWLAQAEDVDLDTAHSQDVEHFFWNQGLSWDSNSQFVAQVMIQR
jgi:hypothetical protein